MGPSAVPPQPEQVCDSHAQIIDNCEFLMSKDVTIQVITSKDPNDKFFKAYAVRCSPDCRHIVLESDPCENMQRALSSLHTKSCEAVHSYITANGLISPSPSEAKTSPLEPFDNLDGEDDETASIISGQSDGSTAAFSEWNDSGDEAGTGHAAKKGDKASSATRFSDSSVAAHASSYNSQERSVHATPGAKPYRSKTAAAGPGHGPRPGPGPNGLWKMLPLPTWIPPEFAPYRYHAPPPLTLPLSGQRPSLPNGPPGPSGPPPPPPHPVMRAMPPGPPMPPAPFAAMSPYRPSGVGQPQRQHLPQHQHQHQHQHQGPPFVCFRGPHQMGLQMPRGPGESFKPMGPPPNTVNSSENGNNGNSGNINVDGKGSPSSFNNVDSNGVGSSRTNSNNNNNSNSNNNNGTNANTSRNYSGHGPNGVIANPPPPPRPLSFYTNPQRYPLPHPPVQQQQLHAVRITVNWLGHGQHRIVAHCFPTRESLQCAAITDVRLNPGAFHGSNPFNPNNSSGEGSSDSNNVNRNSNGNGNTNESKRPGSAATTSLRAHVRRVFFGGEPYDMRTFIGQDFSHLFLHCQAADGLPSFEVVVEEKVPDQQQQQQHNDSDDDEYHDDGNNGKVQEKEGEEERVDGRGTANGNRGRGGGKGGGENRGIRGRAGLREARVEDEDEVVGEGWD